MTKWIPLKNMNLKSKSILLLVCLVILPMLTISFVIYYQGNEILKRQVTETIYQQLTTMESSLNSVMEDIEDITGYIIYSDEFRSYMTLSTDDYIEEINDLHNPIRTFFTFHLTNKAYFNSVTIEGVNGISLNVGEAMDGEEPFLVNPDLADEREPYWSNPYLMEYKRWGDDEVQVISLYRTIYDLYDIRTPVGEVVIRLNERELYQQIVGNALENHETMLLKSDGTIMFHSNTDKVGETFSGENLLRDITAGKSTVIEYTHHGDRRYLIHRKIGGRNLYLVSIVDEEYLLNEISGIIVALQTIMVITVTLAILAIFGFLYTIIIPIIELTRETRRLEVGDFKANVSVRSNDEVGKLGLRFNKMVKQIQLLINTKYKLELEKKESELKALQNKINPHFLYNTLDMIRWTARIEKAHETGKSIEDLSQLFRISLSHGKDWITLKEEIKYVQSYQTLQKRRSVKPFRFYIAVEHGAKEAYVMKIILQPLVENSLMHGFKAIDSPFIYIRCYRLADTLVLDIIDNGEGMDVEKVNSAIAKVDEAESKNGFALKNIHDRIRYAFGKGYGLTIKEVDQGAHVQMTIPFITSLEELNERIKKGEDHHDH